MARYFDLQSTVLVVVGHGILPEEEDRPIAYELKRAVNARTGGSQDRAAVVVTDAWLMNQELGEFFPAIAVGGPAVKRLHRPDLRRAARRLHARPAGLRADGDRGQARRALGYGPGRDVRGGRGIREGGGCSSA